MSMKYCLIFHWNADWTHQVVSQLADVK